MRRGLTVVEVLIVMALLGLLLTLAGGSSVNSRVRLEEGSVPTLLRKAREQLRNYVDSGKLVDGAEVRVGADRRLLIVSSAYGLQTPVGTLPATCSLVGGSVLYSASYDYVRGTVLTSHMRTDGGTVSIVCRYRRY